MKSQQEINTQFDNLYNLMRFLKDNYHRRVFNDLEFGAALVKFHMSDFNLNFTNDDASRIAFLLSPVKN